MNNYQDNIALQAGADLTSTQYKAVAVGGTIAANNTAAMGIQQNKPRSGEPLTVAMHGRSFYVAAGAIAAGAALIVTTSGYMTTATSGTFPVGRNLEAVSSGGIGEGYFNFANAKTSLGA